MSADPKFDNLFGRDDQAARALRREAYLVQVATANARKQYLKTGQAPTFAEAWAEIQDGEKRRKGVEETGDEEPVSTDLTISSTPLLPASLSAIFGTAAPLTRSYNGYGHEIFVETFEENTGKPLIWYQRDKKGTKRRFTRNPLGIRIETLGPGPFL